MSKPRKKYRPRPARAPMLVIRQTIPELGIAERMAVEAFAGGWATSDQFDVLADCRNILMLAAAEKADKDGTAIAELGLVALQNIKDREQEKGRFGATGEEIKALRALVEFSDDFWNRQPGTAYSRHYDALVRAGLLLKGAA